MLGMVHTATSRDASGGPVTAPGNCRNLAEQGRRARPAEATKCHSIFTMCSIRAGKPAVGKVFW